MDTIDEKILDDFLAPGTGVDMTPEHRAWINGQVKQRLAKIEAGEMGFKTLQDVRRKFGL